MHKVDKLSNGLTLITIDLPSFESVTTLLAVGAGSRYETKKINGISHFLEHMFFKGSKKYPTTEIIASLVDGIGAINNAGTSKEYTYYFIKSAAQHIELATDIISSQIKEPLFEEVEIEREKSVIVEELRMYRDMPQRYIFDLIDMLLFGDQPLGWDTGGEEKTVNSFTRDDFIKYVQSLYSPSNMCLIYAGKLPKNIKQLAEKYFNDLPKRDQYKFKPFKKTKQTKPKLNLLYKQTDQANLVLAVHGYDRHDDKRYAAEVLGAILGSGMSSRLFLQVRERRGLAYAIDAGHEHYVDTGVFYVYGGLKLEKVNEGLEVILGELKSMKDIKVTPEELKKVKELIRGRVALSTESTNYLAQRFGIQYVLDRKIETFEEYLKKIDAVTAEDVQQVAKELFKPENYNLQLIGPFKSLSQFEKILNS